MTTMLRRPRVSRRHDGIARLVLLVAISSACGSDTVGPGRTAADRVDVTPTSISIAAGATASLSARVLDASGAVLTDRTVFWASRDVSIATVSQTGVVTGVAPGSTQIAASADGKSGVASITITPKPVASVRITPTAAKLLVGQAVQLNAQALDANGAVLTGRSVTWDVGDPTIATVDSHGVVTGIAPGATTVMATIEGKSAVATATVSAVPVRSVVISPAADTIVVGQTAQLTAAPLDSAGGALSGRLVVWQSSDDSIASVSSTGLVLAFAPGTATITATVDGIVGTARVLVSSAPVASIPVATVLVSPSQSTLTVGQTVQLTALPESAIGATLIGRAVTWSSSDGTIAVVSSSGRVLGIAPGTATITATCEGVAGTATVTVQ